MSNELKLLQNYLVGYAKAKNESERKIMFARFEDNNIADLMKKLQETRELKGLKPIELFYADEIIMVNKYYKELKELIKTYKAEITDLKDTLYLTSKYCNMTRTHDTVELFLAYRLLNTGDRMALREIAKREPISRSDCLIQRLNNIIHLYREGISLEDLAVLANHYYLTYNVFIQAVTTYSKECTEQEKKILSELSRQMYTTNNKVGIVIMQILEFDDYNILLKSFIDEGYTIEELRKMICKARNSKLLSLTDDEKAKLIEFLNITIEYRKEQIKKEAIKEATVKTEEFKPTENLVAKQEKKNHNVDSLEEAQKVMRDFEMSGYTTKIGYCVNCHVDVEYFEKCKQMVDEQRKGNHKKADQSFAAICNELASKITNGIEDNGTIRKFDIIDFYEITNSSIEEVLNQLAFVPYTKNISIIRGYLNKKNELLSNLSSARFIVNAKYDEQGNLIPDSGREITKKEKEQIIAYLESKNIPVNGLSFKAMINRYVYGFISFEQEKVKRR